jgi:hypothetical protein
MPTATELLHGVPLFLDQLTDTLREEAASGPHNAPDVPVAPRDVPKRSSSIELERTAGRHGNELLRKGYTVDQVVHDYGDLCQAVTELALEENAPPSKRTAACSEYATVLAWAVSSPSIFRRHRRRPRSSSRSLGIKPFFDAWSFRGQRGNRAWHSPAR